MSIIQKYFPNLSPTQIEQFEKLEGLYRDWNAKINLISRNDIDDLHLKHVLHSLGIAKVQPFQSGAEILDVGTGGGFPGIPLAILFPEAHFHLIDSIGKKIMVVDAISQALALQNVSTEKIRAEQVTGSYDFIVSRAVTQMNPFVEWVKHLVKRESAHQLTNGILALKGGDLEEELSQTDLRCAVFDLVEYFEESFFETKKVVHLPLGENA